MKTSLFDQGEAATPTQHQQIVELKQSLTGVSWILSFCLTMAVFAGYYWLSANIVQPWLHDGANWVDALAAIGLFWLFIHAGPRIEKRLLKDHTR